MTGSVALDVVIGLVFIYLLYSLFATIIMEIITSIFGLRARNLRYALCRMLMDEREFEGRFAPIKKFLLMLFNTAIKISGRSGNLKNTQTFDGFYNQPTIKYLGDGGVSNKPSYLTSQNFSKALIDTLKSDSNGKSALIKIKEGIDSLPANSDTKAHLQSLLEDANNDLLKFKLLLEQWFDDTMERSTGWFKRRVQYILFIIGFVLAVSFNANTLVIIKKLSKDPEARQQLVDMAINYAKENKETIAYIDSLKARNKDKDNIGINDGKDSLLINKIDTLLSISKSLKSDIYEAQNIISSNWRIPDTLKVVSRNVKAMKDSLLFNHKLKVFQNSDTCFKRKGNDSTVFFVVNKSIDIKVLKCILPEKISESQLTTGIPINKNTYTRKYVFASGGFFKHLWGYVLTALAISLGSPFWFDLLNKLIKLRSSVQQTSSSTSEKEKGESQQTNIPINQRVG